MAVAFIADLHLTMERPAGVALFTEFLGEAAGQLEHLYILGDLFEYWVGDDGAAEPEFAPILTALRQATTRGLPISVMHGNRDFLLSRKFTRTTGCILLRDPHPITLFGTRVLLSHGDALCTDDTEYMALRRRLRNPFWQWLILRRSLAARMAMARRLRRESSMATSQKPEMIMDVNTNAVRALLGRHRVRQLIHGHTHRPGRYQLDGPEGVLERVVVGDWYEGSSILVAGPRGLRLAAVPDLVGAIAEVMGG